jgi:hypothetical protein
VQNNSSIALTVDDDTVLNKNELSRKHKGIGNMNKTTSSESEAEKMGRAIALNLTTGEFNTTFPSQRHGGK